MAATDEIEMTVVHGKGGHAAMPHLGVDPVVVAAHLISALQTIASRNVSPVDAVVVSLCSLQTSQLGAYNVIPDFVKMIGTLRSFRAETRALAEARVREIVATLPRAFGASAEIVVKPGYPPTVNSAREAEFAALVGKRVFGKDKVVRDADPTMGGEDFTYVLRNAPVPMCGSARAEDPPAASCTTRSTTSTTRSFRSARATSQRWSKPRFR